MFTVENAGFVGGEGEEEGEEERKVVIVFQIVMRAKGGRRPVMPGDKCALVVSTDGDLFPILFGAKGGRS